MDQAKQHTPEPWHFECHDDFYKVCDAQGVTVADIPIQPLDPGTWAEGNAILITAAPELLEACEEFVRKVDAGEARSTRSYRQMKTAIAKARGRI